MDDFAVKAVKMQIDKIKQAGVRALLGALTLVLFQQPVLAQDFWSNSVAVYDDGADQWDGEYAYSGTGTNGAPSFTEPIYLHTLVWYEPYQAWHLGNAWSGELGYWSIGSKYDPESARFKQAWTGPPWTEEALYFSPKVVWTNSNNTGNELPDTIHCDPFFADGGEPVNMISGSMIRDETDVVIPCPGIDLVFSRAYRSGLDYTNGGMGPRWIHNFDWHVSETADVRDIYAFTNVYTVSNDWLVIRNSEGEQKTLSFITTNQWEGHRGNNWEAIKLSNSEYRVYLPGRTEMQFNTNGVLTKISDLWSNSLSFTYTSNFLTKIEYNNGQYLNLSYQSNLLTQVTTPSNGFYISYYYNNLHELTNATRTIAGGSYPISYFYDTTTNHSITQIINAAGTILAWAYQTNGAGHATSWCTNSFVVSNYYQTAFSFDTNDSRTTMIVDRNGVLQTNKFYYSEDKQITREEKLTANTVHTLAHDPISRQVIRDRWGDATLGEYFVTDAQYQGVYVTNTGFGYNAEPSNFWTYTWDTNWQVITSTTDPEGHKIEIEHTNALVNRTKLYYTASNTYDTLYSYTTNGLLSGVTNANGHYVTFAYDSYGFMTSSVPQVGPAVRYKVNQLGFTTNIILPGDSGDRITALDVNELGWVSKITYPDGLYETASHDNAGNVTNSVDRAGRTNIFTYLPTKKLASVVRPLSSGVTLTNRVEYDNQFNTLKIYDAKNRAVETYGLDLQDRVTTVTNLEGQTMTVTYGAGDFVRQISRFDGTTVTNTIDTDGRITSVKFPETTNTFTYLKNNLLLTAANEVGTISNSWSFANRLTSQSSAFIGVTSAVAYSYFPAGQVSNVISIAGTNTYTLDNADRVAVLESASTCGAFGAIGGNLRFENSFNPNIGLLSSVACTNTGVTVSYGYGAMNQVTNITWRNSSSNVIAQFAYRFNNALMITNRQVSGLLGQWSDNYQCDDLDRLISETSVYPEQSERAVSFVYDEVGNRTAKTNGGTSVTYAYSNNSNRLTGWTAASTNNFGDVRRLDVFGSSSENIGTNANLGRLYVSNSVETAVPAVSGTNFSRNIFSLAQGTNQVIAAIGDVAGNVGYATNTVVVQVATNGAYGFNNAGCVTSVVYSGAGFTNTLGLNWNTRYELTSAYTNGILAESYQYDVVGRRISIFDGTTTNFLVYDGDNVIAEVDSSGVLKKSYVYGVPGLLAMTTYGASTNTYYMLTDYLGTIHAVVDGTGTIVESYRYDAWGKILGVYNGSGAPLAESAIGNRFLFHGKEYSWRTDLYLNGARWYDPVGGRFISKDPSGIANGLNEYEFCNNNPVSFVDPDGEGARDSHDWWSKAAISGIEHGGVAGYAQAAGCSIMMSFIDFFGARSIEANAELSGHYSAIDGCGWNAAKYGAYAIGEGVIVASTHAGFMRVARVSRTVQAAKMAEAVNPKQPRFIADEARNVVDTTTTTKGRYIQLDGSKTDILQKHAHPGYGNSHTHVPGTRTTPSQVRPVSPQDFENIQNGTAVLKIR